MYKVLLVDDEMFVRKGLMQLIDWEALGYSVAGEAENGEEALATIERTEPDLVITDIRMPVLDGLELIKAVREKGKSDPKFIIISGYHDFNYAQQAIRYGVHDYVLKPVDEEELISALKKLSGKLGMKKLDKMSQGKSAKGSILEALVQGNIPSEDARDFASALQLENAGPYTYILMEVSPNVNPNPKGSGDERTVISAREAASAIMELGIWGQGDLVFYEQSPGRFGMLADAGRLAAAGGNMGALLRAVQSGLSKALGVSVTLYAGKSVDTITAIKDSYLSAIEAAQYKFACDGEPVIFYDKVQGLSLYYLDMDQDLYTQLLEQVEENKVDAFTKSVDGIFHEFHNKRFAPAAVANSITRCLIGIAHVIREMEGDERSLGSLEDVVEWQQLRLDLKGLKKLFLRFILEAADYIDRLRKEQTKGGIEKIRKYIETHFTQNISLKTIAAQFYMNPVYLGQLFRKTYGVYFNDFLLNLRVQEAKKLLRQTDMRMYEIAEKVGFHNADYFVTQFEKLEHMTPTEYRNKLIGKK